MMKVFAIGTFVLILLTAFGAAAEMTNDWVEAEIQGRQLAQQIWEYLEQRPAENLTNTVVLIIRDAKGRHSEVSVQVQTMTGVTRWSTTYETTSGSNQAALVVIHEADRPNQYQLYNSLPLALHSPELLAGNETMNPFAGSDFWIADLGLEFFRWPEQKILRHEMRRGRSCKVLESTNPNPTPNAYSRVVSWIDNETLGIVQAEAYDTKGKLLKEFYPKSFKKVNGQWELQEMDIRNDQTGSRTWLKFDLKPHG
jgi:hypothetical protein